MTSSCEGEAAKADHRVHHEEFLQRVESLLQSKGNSRGAALNTPSRPLHQPNEVLSVPPTETEEEEPKPSEPDALEGRLDNLKLRSELRKLKQSMQDKADENEDLRSQIQVLRQENEIAALRAEASRRDGTQETESKSSEAVTKCTECENLNALKEEVASLRRELYLKQQELLCLGREMQRKSDAWEVERLLVEREMDNSRDQLIQLTALARDATEARLSASPLEAHTSPKIATVDKSTETTGPTLSDQPSLRTPETDTKERPRACANPMEVMLPGKKSSYRSKWKGALSAFVPSPGGKQSRSKIKSPSRFMDETWHGDAQKHPDIKTRRAALDADRLDDCSTSAGTKSTVSYADPASPEPTRTKGAVQRGLHSTWHGKSRQPPILSPPPVCDVVRTGTLDNSIVQSDGTSQPMKQSANLSTNRGQKQTRRKSISACSSTTEDRRQHQRPLPRRRSSLHK